MDKDGFPFEYPAAEIPWMEQEKIRHEINSNYRRYEGKGICLHPSYGIDNMAYDYFFENRGFDNINIFKRRINLN